MINKQIPEKIKKQIFKTSKELEKGKIYKKLAIKNNNWQ